MSVFNAASMQAPSFSINHKLTKTFSIHFILIVLEHGAFSEADCNSYMSELNESDNVTWLPSKATPETGKN